MWQLINQLLPRQCILCHVQIQHNNIEICVPCSRELPWLAYGCEKCSLPLICTSNRVCGKCSMHAWPFTRTIAPFVYTSWIKLLISKYKYAAKLSYGTSLAQILASHIAAQYTNIPLPQVIIPVPLFSKKLRRRGFNQSYLLADVISKSLGIKIFRGCKKITESLPQATLSKNARHSNLSKSFIIEQQISASSVAIVDDVVTTGATALELAKVLAAAGVLDIHLWAIARAI